MKRYAKEIKDEVLKRIRGGEKVAVVAKAHGIHEVTVRNWLERDTELGGSAQILEVSRLKREVEGLLRLVGQLTYDSDNQKKKSQSLKH